MTIRLIFFYLILFIIFLACKKEANNGIKINDKFYGIWANKTKVSAEECCNLQQVVAPGRRYLISELLGSYTVEKKIHIRTLQIQERKYQTTEHDAHSIKYRILINEVFLLDAVFNQTEKRVEIVQINNYTDGDVKFLFDPRKDCIIKYSKPKSHGHSRLIYSDLSTENGMLELNKVLYVCLDTTIESSNEMEEHY